MATLLVPNKIRGLQVLLNTRIQYCTNRAAKRRKYTKTRGKRKRLSEPSRQNKLVFNQTPQEAQSPRKKSRVRPVRVYLLSTRVFRIEAYWMMKKHETNISLSFAHLAALSSPPLSTHLHTLSFCYLLLPPTHRSLTKTHWQVIVCKTTIVLAHSLIPTVYNT